MASRGRRVVRGKEISKILLGGKSRLVINWGIYFFSEQPQPVVLMEVNQLV